MIKKYKMFFIMVFSALVRRHSRILVALLAVAVGATIISGMLTIYQEVPRQMGREFRAYGANMLILPNNEQTNFDAARLDTVKQALSSVEVVGVTPFLYQSVEVNKQPVMVGGTDFDSLQKVSSYWQINGKWPQKDTKEVLLGAELAKKLSKDPEKLIGQKVSISAGEEKPVVSFTVSGIASIGSKEEQFAFVDLGQFQDLIEKKGQISLAQVSIVADGQQLETLKNQVQAADPDVQVQLIQQIAHSEWNVLSKLQVLILLVTIIILILTLICVTTTMMAVVTERRKEIGLKKALGASNANIVSEFFGEGCLLGAFGGILGSGFGYWFAQSVSMNVFTRHIAFSPGITLLAIVVSIIITGAASIIPVRIATNVDPAIVLRGE